jgi:hypothetical protein
MEMSSELPVVEKPGTYMGYMVEQRVAYSKNRALQLIAGCELRKVFKPDSEGGAFAQLRQPVQATGYLTIRKTNGALLGAQYGRLKKALDWDGDIEALHTGDFSRTEVKIIVGESEWDGKLNCRIDWILHPEATLGGIGQTSPEEFTKIRDDWHKMKAAIKAKKAEHPRDTENYPADNKLPPDEDIPF